MRKVPGFQPEHLNKKIKKCDNKVVDTVDMEDLGDKVPKNLNTFRRLMLTFRLLTDPAFFYRDLRCDPDRSKVLRHFSGSVLPLLEELQVPLLRRVPQQAQRIDRGQRRAAHRQEVVMKKLTVTHSRAATCYLRTECSKRIDIFAVSFPIYVISGAVQQSSSKSHFIGNDF